MRASLNVACRSRGIVFALMASFAVIALGMATVSISGDFYNSDYSTSLTEVGENVNSAGYVVLTPSGGLEGYPYSILASGSACANQVNGSDADFSSSISVAGKGKSFSTNAMIHEDAEIAPVLASKWSYSTALGDTASLNGVEGCSLGQEMTIATISGYFTYPTSAHLHPSVTTGIVSKGFDENGRTLLHTQFVPSLSFGYPLTLAVYFTPGAHVENVLKMNVKW